MASHEPRWAVLTVFAAGFFFLIRHLTWPALFGLVFIAWAALSLLWSPDPRQGALNLQSMICLWAVFVFFRQHVTALPVWAMPICVLGALGLYLWWPVNYGGFGNENWIAEWLLIAVPLCFLNRWFGLAIGVLASAHLALENTSSTSLLVVAVACAIQLGRVRWWAAFFALALAAGAPFAFPDFFRQVMHSITTRLELTYNSLFVWLEYPLFGTGVGGFNYAYHAVQEKHFEVFTVGRSALPGSNYYVGYAHNEPIQLFAEYGVVGAALMAAFLFAAIRGAKVGPYGMALVAAGVISFVAFPLQNPATAVLIAAALGMVTKDWVCPSRRRATGVGLSVGQCGGRLY